MIAFLRSAMSVSVTQVAQTDVVKFRYNRYVNCCSVVLIKVTVMCHLSYGLLCFRLHKSAQEAAIYSGL
jgi:hypothetical protein